MKFLKLIGVFLILFFAIAIILSLILPVHQTIEKNTVINAPASEVYDQLVKLKNFNNWSVWNNHDSSIKITYGGIDGTIGATTSWSGDPAISGDGKIEIAELEPNKKIVQDVQFISPKKGKAVSIFLLDDKNGITTITWKFKMFTPRPWNIFNLFYSMDKQMGKDFEDGLSALKRSAQKDTAATVDAYKPVQLNFPATTFAAIRQVVKFSDIGSFYGKHLPVLYEETNRLQISAGTPSGLYYSWDEKNQQTDMATALPVPSRTSIDNAIINIISIPASKAVVANYYGSYDHIKDAYNSLDKYFKENDLKRKMPVIEQYVSGPQSEKDTSKWLTKIVYLVD
ncbi:MAG TPA: GyrI-like domain-containing protein [Chitinophagaceae bacterium]|nr:GyrI-like domain-containing protein [Chitinophagaceae bacterium]